MLVIHTYFDTVCLLTHKENAASWPTPGCYQSHCARWDAEFTLKEKAAELRKYGYVMRHYETDQGV